MLLFYSLIQPLMSLNLAAQDLFDTSWSVTGWSAITSGGSITNPYSSISNLCNNQNMIQLTNQYLTYQKTYTITDYEFYQLFIELDVYFYTFTQTTINIIVNAQNIYSQQFTSSILTQNNICNTGSDSQYTIFQGFYTTQQTLIVQIQYKQNTINANSYVGIKNLNIYSNGIPLIGGCPMSTPLNSNGVCGTVCTTTNPYFTGQYWNQCGTGTNTSSALRFNLLTNANNFQMNYAPTAQEQTYLYFTDTVYMIPNSNIYTSSIMHSNLFTTLYKSTDIYYYYSISGVGAANALQFILVFYVFGDWDDGSYVSFYVSGNAQYSNSMITISKQQGQYYSSTQSLFYNTNVTQSGVNIQAKKTLIALSGRCFAVSVRLGLIQFLSGSTASYGFGNIVIHKALSDPNFAFPSNTDIYGLPFTCLNGLYAYNGTCVSSCPVYSFTSTTNKNCTDYSASESSIYNSAIPISSNAYGTYIIKQFYQNNFLQTDIDSLFQTKPPTSKNYLNGESFSFISSKKILGGYNSWGYGTYQAQFTNLKAHFQVRFFFTLYLIDGWQVGDSFTYQVDGVVVDTYTKSPSQQYQGLSTQDSIYVISGRKVSHGSSTLTISFNCNVAYQDSSKASCGIQNLFVLIDQNVNILCPLTTQYFSYTTQNCETCTISPCQLFPANTITAKCSIGCLTCTSSTVCTACDTSNGYQLSGNACVCQSNYIMVSSICQSNHFINLECYYQCTTCSGTASNLCSSCDATRTLTSNSCPCNSNYYDVQSVTACSLITTTCHYSCSTCYGIQYNQCVTCPAYFSRTFQSLSNTCTCDPTYQDNGLAQCVPQVQYMCDISCLTCNGAGSTNCTSCDSTKKRTSLISGQCLCDTGYNDILSPGNACVANYTPCHYTCDTCYGSTNANCLTCLSANFRTISSNQCPCNNGYLDITLSQCASNYSPCHYSCLTCFGTSSNQCLACPSTRDLNVVTLGSQSSCNCQAGTYNNSVATCATCDSTCQNCTAAGSNSCSSCDSTKHRTLSGTTCPCSNGYNDILNPNNTCVVNYTPCHQNCLTCYGSLSNNCITCDGSNNRVLTSSFCDCDTNYSDIGYAACLLNYTPCHSSCSTCYGAASNQCSSCGAGRTINIVSLGVDSSCPCSSSYYASGQSCLACHSSCLTCNGGTSTNCTDCDSSANRALLGNSCSCMNSYNEFLNPGTCVANLTTCHNTCTLCFGPANNQCIECNPNRELIQNSCLCSSGYNEILNAGTCVTNYTPCHEQCDTCYGPLISNCISCDPTSNRSYNSDTFTCPCYVGYIDVGMFYCVLPYSPCDSSCLTCFGDQIDQCLTCSSTRTLNIVSTGNQVCGCKPKYYEVVGDSDCTACHYACASCDGSTDVNCTSCNANRVLTTNSCSCITNYNDLNGTLSDCQLNYSPCHFSCQTCFGGNANQCLDCPSGSLRTHNNASQTCDCPTGYDDSQTICFIICDATCLTCKGPQKSDCLTCQIDVRLLSSNSCICSDGTNDKLNPPTCETDIIFPNCYSDYVLSCFGIHYNQALSCDSSFHRNLDTNNACICNDGFYENVSTQSCQACNTSCKTCSQKSRYGCLTCDNTKNRVNQIDSSNSCPCLANYNDVLNLDQACVADLTTCHFSCLTCYGIDINQCLTCSVQSLRLLQQFSCNCMDGYFDNNQTQCLQCDSKCELCQYQSDICTQCNSNNFRYLQDSKCVCIDGYYENNKPVCEVCNEDCQICNKEECLKCRSSQRQLVKGQCLCYEGYYLKNQDCHQCEGFCTSCIGSPELQCLSCGNNRILLNNQCVCKKGYFNYNNNCLECQYSEGKQYRECMYQNDNDGVWTPGEQCDDGNKITRDGCSEFKIDDGYYCDNMPMTPSICYKCPDNCEKCLQNNMQVYCLNCIQKYFQNQNYCYKCQENCLNCLSYSFCIKCIYNIQPIDGKCQICEPGYKQQGKICQSICGDGLITKEEQCDDHNLYDNDGCSSKCQIEQGYICNPQCRLEQNDIKAKLVKSATSTNNIQIEILNYIFDLTQLEIKIDLFSINQDYQYKVSSINQNKFEIVFEFNKPIKSFNIIHIYIPIKQNKRLLDYIVRELSLIPEEANYYDSTQQSQRQNIKQTQQQFYQSLLYIGPIAFLLGGTSFFIQILDILSWINNFYYINVNYPGNVEIFFQQSNWGLIFSIPQIFQFSIEDNNQQLPQKFQDKGVDSLILNNIQQTLLTFIIIVCCIPLSKQCLNSIKRYTNNKHKKKVTLKLDMQCEIMPVLSQNEITLNQSQQFKQNYFLVSIQNQLQNFYNNRYVVLFKVININILDVCLAIIINLKYQNYFQDILKTICFIFCMIMTILCLTYFYCLYYIAQLHKTLLRFKLFKNLYNQLFEGIKSDRISRLYGFQSMFQKSLFIISVVIFFEKPVQQTLFCSSLLTGLLVLVTYQNPFRKGEDILSQLIPDVLLTFILLLSTILAADEQVNTLTYQDRYNLGWVILAFIGISILIQLLFIFKEAFEQLQIKYKWIKSTCL